MKPNNDAKVANAPVKFRQPQKSPSSKNFVFRPKLFTNISNYVTKVNWLHKEKKLQIEVDETPNFEVYNWIAFIQEESQELQKSPFCNLDKNMIFLDLLDENKVQVAQIRFKNLSLFSHCCALDNSFTNTPLCHKIEIDYQYSEFVQNKLEEELPRSNLSNDDEWQTVETA